MTILIIRSQFIITVRLC